MNVSITIQDLDEATVAWIHEEAKRRGMSVDMFVLQLIQKGIGLERKSSEPPIYNDLDSLAGTWSDEEATEFLNAIADFNKVDENLWQ
jgi:hypothetical protein